MQSITINVAGHTFQIRSDADEEYLKELAQEVTSRFRAICKTGARHDQETKAMAMVAIMALDELKSTSKAYDALRDKTRLFAQQMVARIDELLAREES